MFITVLATISREDFVPLVMDQLANAVTPGHDCQLILALDNKTISWIRLEKELSQLPNRALFKEVKIFNTGRRPPSRFSMGQRRNRIAYLHGEVRQYLAETDYLFCFEDDTIVPDEVVQRLLQRHLDLSHFNPGIIEGVQVGRWGREYVGAWRREGGGYLSLLPEEGRDISEMDGGGLYCFMVPTRLYREARFRWKEPLGPDVWFGIDLRDKGYANFIDWTLPCGHVAPAKTLWPDNPVAVSIMTMENGRTNAKILTREEYGARTQQAGSQVS